VQHNDIKMSRSVNVKYIIDSKVEFLRYTRTYSLSGRRCRGMIFEIFIIHCMISFRFVSHFTYFVSFRFDMFRFCFVSHFTGTQYIHVPFSFFVTDNVCILSFSCSVKKIPKHVQNVT
jgi:hypothetical protein